MKIISYHLHTRLNFHKLQKVEISIFSPLSFEINPRNFNVQSLLKLILKNRKFQAIVVNLQDDRLSHENNFVPSSRAFEFPQILRKRRNFHFLAIILKKKESHHCQSRESSRFEMRPGGSSCDLLLQSYVN